MSKNRAIIQPKLNHYLMATWYARWLAIAIVAASLWFLPHIDRRVAVALVIIAALYNGALWAGRKADVALVYNRLYTIVADSILVIILVACTGQTASPYASLLILIIVSASYWYGAMSAFLVGTLELFIIEFIALMNHLRAVPRGFTVEVAIFITMGVYVAWLSQSERSERSELIALSARSERERQQLLALINNMPDAVLVVDNSDNIVIYNQAAGSLAGGHESLQGKPVGGTIRFEAADNQPAELKIKHTTAAFERKDLLLRAPDNSLVNVVVSVAPYTVDRQNRGHVLIIRDVTQEKTIDKEREEFVAVASHELRTPLTIAQGDISMLLSPPYPKGEESVHMLNGALRSLQQLSHIIKDLTNLSRVESEQLEVDLEPLDPAALLQEFQADYQDQAKAKNLELQVKIDPHLSSATILTSRYVVREILSIFITNALKFTDRGVVTLTVKNTDDKLHGVTFAVSDTGVGIAHSDQKRIFEKFFQSEDYSTRVHGGTGLGLYIAKQLASRITGKVWFETERDKGSTFYLSVPPYSQDKKDRSKVAAAETKDFFNNV